MLLDLFVSRSLQVSYFSVYFIEPVTQVVETFLELPLAIDNQSLLVSDLARQLLEIGLDVLDPP